MDPQPTPRRLPEDVKFRVLIIGRANAGKTTILQRVCDTTNSPAIYGVDPSGIRKLVRSQSQSTLSLSSSRQVELEPTIEVGQTYPSL
jgi:GTP-binding protein EngB required for normal cell division